MKKRIDYISAWEVRYWVCRECGMENETRMESPYIVPTCCLCGAEFEWGNVHNEEEK